MPLAPNPGHATGQIQNLKTFFAKQPTQNVNRRNVSVYVQPDYNSASNCDVLMYCLSTNVYH